MSKNTLVNPVVPKPGAFQPTPPVRQPVTGVPMVPGFPDGSKQNILGPRPTGKGQAK